MNALSAKELAARFHRRLRYQEARPWQKPFLNPVRFVRNQLRKRGVPPLTPGQLRTTRTFHMENFTVVNGENVSEQIAAYGVYEANLTESLLRLVRPGSVVTDIGMHIGYYTTLFARLVGDLGEVHAFEPTPSTREIAAQNVCRFHNITVHPYAMWSSVTKLQFQDFGLPWMAFNSLTARRPGVDCPPASLIEVQTTTLDDFRGKLPKPLSLIKIDAESAEPEILRGAKEVLEKDRPVISLEVGDAEGKFPSKGLIELMQRAGYTPWEMENGSFVRHTPKNAYFYDNIIFAHTECDLSNGGSPTK